MRIRPPESGISKQEAGIRNFMPASACRISALLFCISVILLPSLACNLPVALQFEMEPPPGAGGAGQPVLAAATPAAALTPDNAPCDLLIVAPQAFLPALQPLVEHKNRRGLSSCLLGLEDIYTAYPGRDEAEKVKHALAENHQQRHIRFAFLIGDADRFPLRYTATDRQMAVAFNTAFYPTNLYYADLFKPDGSFADWDANANGYFGELGGESRAGSLNLDGVDLHPEIAVGRLPASNAPEVSLYVEKVIQYETAASADWQRRVLLLATSDYAADACQVQENVARSLPGYDIVRLYGRDNRCAPTGQLDPAVINAQLNQGAAFVSYVGHGTRSEWQGCYSAGDLVGLSNRGRLPVVFATGCSTAEFATLPPYDAYTDLTGQRHRGTNQGEVFSARPPQPGCIQTENNVEGLAEAMLFNSGSGAIIYIGAVSASQEYAFDLNRFFFAGLGRGLQTPGEMWNEMLRRYYELHDPLQIIDPPDWGRVAEFHQPWKFVLFGDPSLKIRMNVTP